MRPNNKILNSNLELIYISKIKKKKNFTELNDEYLYDNYKSKSKSTKKNHDYVNKKLRFLNLIIPNF